MAGSVPGEGYAGGSQSIFHSHICVSLSLSLSIKINNNNNNKTSHLTKNGVIVHANAGLVPNISADQNEVLTLSLFP